MGHFSLRFFFECRFCVTIDNFCINCLWSVCPAVQQLSGSSVWKNVSTKMSICFDFQVCAAAFTTVTCLPWLVLSSITASLSYSCWAEEGPRVLCQDEEGNFSILFLAKLREKASSSFSGLKHKNRTISTSTMDPHIRKEVSLDSKGKIADWWDLQTIPETDTACTTLNL